MTKHRVERSFSRESSDMQFIDDVVVDGQTEPVRIRPVELWRNDFGWPVHAVGLISRDRIGNFLAVRKSIQIASPGRNALHDSLVVSELLRLHGNGAIFGGDDVN